MKGYLSIGEKLILIELTILGIIAIEFAILVFR